MVNKTLEEFNRQLERSIRLIETETRSLRKNAEERNKTKQKEILQYKRY